MLKINDYIRVNNEYEWYHIQKYLFSIGYLWCDNTKKFLKFDDTFPNYILIEQNHMFSYNHDYLKLSSKIYDAKELINIYRSFKLERILNKK